MELLNKDKSQCTPEELELIRRERNRYHAKRTRLRKKRIAAEAESMITQLEKEVHTLRERLKLQNNENTCEASEHVVKANVRNQ